jgi:phage terminase large subunit-like protein
VTTDLEYAARAFESQTMRLGRPPLEAHQRPPRELLERERNVWLLEAGRGSGKTEAMSRYFSRFMSDNPGVRGRIIAPRLGDAIEACIIGPSGLLAVDERCIWRPGAAGGSKVIWPNGSEALVLGTYSPKDVDALRAGGNRHIDWWEEMAANRNLAEAWKQAKAGLRLGFFPHSIVSTTPRTTKAYIKIRGDKRVIRVHATMYDNPYNSPEWRKEMEEDYANTRWGRQEIHGLLLEDIEGALWTLELLATVHYNQPLPPLVRIITVVDPSGSEDGDATGIITIGRDKHHVLYVLADDTTQGTPEHRYATACRAASRWGADAIVYESNYGADNIKMNLRSSWESLVREGEIEGPMPRLEPSNAKGSKVQRAEPVVGLYEQHAKGTERIWHAHPLPMLEDQQTTWEAESDWSPDRIDALVHGVHKLATRIGRRRSGEDQTRRAAETIARGSLAAPTGRSPLPPLARRG